MHVIFIYLFFYRQVQVLSAFEGVIYYWYYVRVLFFLKRQSLFKDKKREREMPEIDDAVIVLVSKNIV